MDLGNIIYIIAILAYFIYQATRKRGGQEPSDLPDSQSQIPEKGMTFEDMLREIRNAQNPSAPEAVAPHPKPTPIPERRPVIKSRPEVEKYDDEIKHYEGAFEPGKKFKQERASVTAGILDKLNLEVQSQKKVHPVAKKLKKTESIREAIILSEVLNRKHF
jgi:hypothetical protein